MCALVQKNQSQLPVRIFFIWYENPFSQDAKATGRLNCCGQKYVWLSAALPQDIYELCSTVVSLCGHGAKIAGYLDVLNRIAQ